MTNRMSRETGWVRPRLQACSAIPRGLPSLPSLKSARCLCHTHLCSRPIGWARYFEMWHPREGSGPGAGQEHGAGQEASKKRFPLADQPYPAGPSETRDSLAVRAQLSASAFITLNGQVCAVVLPASPCGANAAAATC
jgi:hypothetical protein